MMMCDDKFTLRVASIPALREESEHPQLHQVVTLNSLTRSPLTTADDKPAMAAGWPALAGSPRCTLRTFLC